METFHVTFLLMSALLFLIHGGSGVQCGYRGARETIVPWVQYVGVTGQQFSCFVTLIPEVGLENRSSLMITSRPCIAQLLADTAIDHSGFDLGHGNNFGIIKQDDPINSMPVCLPPRGTPSVPSDGITMEYSLVSMRGLETSARVIGDTSCRSPDYSPDSMFCVSTARVRTDFLRGAPYYNKLGNIYTLYGIYAFSLSGQLHAYYHRNGLYPPISALLPQLASKRPQLKTGTRKMTIHDGQSVMPLGGAVHVAA